MRRSLGLSLIEVITALAIFGILCGYGLLFTPALHKKNQVEVIADEIRQAIQYAKIEALTNARTITLAPLSENDDWSMGMRLFIDNDSHRLTTDAELIREWRWHNCCVKVNWQGFESDRYLRFSPDLIGRGANGHFMIHDHMKHQINLAINRIGRVRQDKSLLGGVP